MAAIVVLVSTAAAQTDGIKLYDNATLDANDNNITNFFEDACGTGEVVQRVYQNGSYRCIDIDSASDATQNLAETLEAGNFADGSDIVMNGSANINLSNGNLSEVERITFDDAIRLGTSSEVNSTGDIAIGKGSYARGINPYTGHSNETAIGSNSRVRGTEGVALGSNSKAIGNFATSIGGGSEAELFGTALGSDSIATTRSVAVGSLAEGLDHRATVVGREAVAGEQSVSMGFYSNASPKESVSIGYVSNVTGRYSTGIGAFSEPQAQFSSSFGYAASAVEDDSTAIGSHASSTAEAAVAIGKYANSPNSYEATFGNLDGEELDVNVTGNLTVHGQDLNLQNGSIENFFNQSQCSSGSVVQQVYSNGSYRCVDIDEVSNSAENLADTLEAGNTANQSINMSGEAIDAVGGLNVTNTSSGTRIAEFTESGVSMYQPLSIESPGPFSVANGVDLTDSTSNTIESYSTMYLSTSSASPSDIVLEPTGDVGIDSNLSITGDIEGFFDQSQCGSGKVVQSVYQNGSYNCIDIDDASDQEPAPENLSETLEAGNVMNRSISLADGQAVEIGTSLSTNDPEDVAIGRNAEASASNNNYEIAIGHIASATGDNSISLGYNSTGSNGYSIALGANTKADNGYASALGSSANASGYGSAAFGTSARASALASSSFGSSGDASGQYSSAFGTFSDASGEGSTAIGTSATSVGNRSLSVGYDSSAEGDYSLAIGSNPDGDGVGAKSSAEGAVAIGADAEAPNSYEATFGNLDGEELDVNVTGNLTVHGSGGLDMRDNQINNLSTPTEDDDAATKKYVDDAVEEGAVENLSETLEAGNTANQSIDMNGNSVDNVSSVSSDSGPVEVENDVNVTSSSPKVSLGDGMSMQRVGGDMVISD